MNKAAGRQRTKTEPADVLIEGARVCDGTGQPAFPANVAIRNGRIAAVSVSACPPARQRLRANGLTVAPGFIDVHTHGDRIVEFPAAENLVRQGITTIVSGNCGSSCLPVAPFLDKVAAAEPALNYATLVGHGSLRRQVMGMAARAPSREELRAMCRLAARAMREGALGMSSGLFYVPGAWAGTDELVEISRAIAEAGGVYASHKRSAGGKVFEAVEEAVEIGRRASISVQISHLKTLHRRGRTRPDRMRELLALIRRCREEGVDVAFDIHPYPATFTSLAAVTIPEWVREGGRQAERLRDAAVRRRIRREVAGKIAWIGGADKIRVLAFEPDRKLRGLTLDVIAQRRKTNAVETAMDLVADGETLCTFHALRQTDTDRALTDELAMIASDGGVVSPKQAFAHPRNFGTFPLVLARYVRELGLLRLEDAVRKMTWTPARKFGLTGRGLVAEGMAADLVVFDSARIGSQADFARPRQAPSGIRWVFVNGRLAWGPRRSDRGRWGQVLRGRDASRRM